MGVPVQDMDPVDEASTEALLSSLRTIAAAERRKHATVFSYWLSIRRGRQIPPIRDLDPLEISDAGPFSVLFEMVGSEDAEIRHAGQAIHAGVAADSSLLSCIARQLPVVAASQAAYAFEDEIEVADGKTRCWVTLLPFSATGTSVDFVYGFVSLDAAPSYSQTAPESVEGITDDDPGLAETEETARSEVFEVPLAPLNGEFESEPVSALQGEEADAEPDTVLELVNEAGDAEPEEEQASNQSGPAATSEPGFSASSLGDLASVGFHDTTAAVNLQLPAVHLPDDPGEADAVEPSEAAAEPADDLVATEGSNNPFAGERSTPDSAPGGLLRNKLAHARAKADEARLAKLRANAALYEGLSDAYDFALDAEENAEEYLKLVEAKGLKIQLRDPMKPVAKLTFDGMCDNATINQLEALLAWAFSEEIPRGMLADRIEAEGGIGPILSGQVRPD